MVQSAGFPTILVLMTDSDTDILAIDAASRLSPDRTPHVIGLYAKPDPIVIADVSTPGALYVLDVQEDIDRRAAEAEARFAETIRTHDLVGEWRCHNGYAGNLLSEHGRCTDLIAIVIDPEAPETSDTIVAAAFGSGHPVLAMPAGRSGLPPWSHVLVAWNGSREAARAISASLPLLASAGRVTVAVVTAADDADTAPGVDMATYLARHGIDVDVATAIADETTDAEALLELIASRTPDLVVMGLYGHSRLREIVLGGASRLMLQRPPCPLFLTH